MRINLWSLFWISPLHRKWIRNRIYRLSFAMRTLRMLCIMDQWRWPIVNYVGKSKIASFVAVSRTACPCTVCVCVRTHSVSAQQSYSRTNNGHIMNTTKFQQIKWGKHWMRSEQFPINGFNNLFITLNYIASIGTLFPKAAVAAHTRFSC